MKDAQLEKLSVDELLDLRTRIDAMVVHKKERKRVELKEKLALLAKEEGFSINDLYNGAVRKVGRGRAGGAVKYQHPDNPALTWSGRGRKPNWVKDSGGDIERYRVDK